MVLVPYDQKSLFDPWTQDVYNLSPVSRRKVTYYRNHLDMKFILFISSIDI